jgi:uncharacterized MAPEG superfamily protein
MMNYDFALFGFWVLALTLCVQFVVASVVKANQPDAIPGKISESLSHGSFVFRAHRTFMNSLENLPLFLCAFLLATYTQVEPYWLGVAVWIYALARIVHMLLYYAIVTERNPSPRSYAFLVGFLATLAILIKAGWQLL